MVNATCAALNCLSSSKLNKDVTFHQFPHDPERRKMWIEACKRTDVINKDWEYFKHKYVCSLHFQKCMYSKKHNLKKTAIPSLHLSDKPIQHDSYTQTWDYVQFIKPHTENKKNESVEQKNYVSTVYVFRKDVKVNTSETQTVESLLFDKHNHEINREIEKDELTHTQIEDSTEDFDLDKKIKDEIEANEISSTQEDSMQIEYDLKEEIKDEFGESEISYPQNEKSLQTIDQIKKESETAIVEYNTKLKQINTHFKEEIKDEFEESEISYPQNEKSLQTIEQIKKESETAIVEYNTKLKQINTQMCHAINVASLKVNQGHQTDPVIIHGLQKRHWNASEHQICECKKRKQNSVIETDITQFLKDCKKFLSPMFCKLVQKQISLDNLINKALAIQSPSISEETWGADMGTGLDKMTNEVERIGASALECVEAGAADCTNANVAYTNVGLAGMTSFEGADASTDTGDSDC